MCGGGGGTAKSPADSPAESLAGGPATVLALWAESVRRLPEAVALRADQEEIDYRGLDEWSSDIARELIGRGIGVGDRVAVLGDRTLGFVAGLLGVLKAGGGVCAAGCTVAC